MKKMVVAAATLLMLAPIRAFAQTPSLADLARQEEARRKAIKKPAKVYTNDDLKSPVTGGAEPAKPAPAPAQAAPEGSTTPPAAKPAPAPDAKDQAQDPKKDPKYWRDRLAGVRAELERSKVYADALQSRINALSTDFVNRDDPAQRAVIQKDRQTALAELDRLQKQVVQLTKSIGDIEEEARRLGVPPGWLR